MDDLDMIIVKNNYNLKKVVDIDIDKLKARLKVIKKYQKQLKILQTIPVIVQKTDEWFKARENMISASDFAQALNEGKFGTQKQLIMKKVKPTDDFKSNMFFEWGNLFESVASDIYSVIHNNIKIYDFGLIKHPKLDFFGASPDGISELGIMLEIKCPLRRKIIPGGDVPLQYYYQIQGQLDVCELNECDYFECEFILYSNYADFYNDNESIKGIILKKNNVSEYSKVYTKNIKYDNWSDDRPYDEMKCWRLNAYNLKRVHRDPIFLKEKLSALKIIWDNIVRYRINETDFTLEVLKSINIDTELLIEPTNNMRPKLTGYLFRD
jgi:putative phage-type endonuclease